MVRRGGILPSECLGAWKQDPDHTIDSHIATSPAPTDSILDQILTAITETRQDLRGKVNAVAIKLSLLCDDQKKLYAHVTQTEMTLDALQSMVTDFM
ncbi:hypothetical protein NDU88_000229 [Pleurodeles waltl]|uniref:Uncharacterized protein n=1 Tax=Pleurodeles waltl TaxID=8319 RepID=A0AAV7UPE6_PLEWA|nr:hypothetical protein NDU88_000229 [Pleurodeles waltl]